MAKEKAKDGENKYDGPFWNPGEGPGAPGYKPGDKPSVEQDAVPGYDQSKYSRGGKVGSKLIKMRKR